MRESGVRQLKAIMFTDIKGFSAMMGTDEERTIRLVTEHRQLIRDILPRHNGHEHETIGDAFVVLFDSAVQAVQCAAEIQGELRALNEARPEDEQIWIRIGIHLGDIVLQDGDIYGDGVNIAARVEPQAEPGGICITQDVFLQVQTKVGLRAVSIGVRELKNITDAPELYRLLLDGDPEPGPAREEETGWPVAPLWKKIVWYVVTLPIALLVLVQVVLSPDGARGLLSAHGLPETLPTMVGVAIGVLLAAGIAVAAIVVQRFWSSGKRSRWLHGPLFLIFPGAGLLLTLYHLLTLNGQLESYLLSASSYAAITEAQADQTSTLIAESIARFLNAVAVDQLIVGLLALIVLLGCLFVRPRGERRPGGWKRWLVVPGALVLCVIAHLALGEVLEFMGLFLFALYLLWILTAVALVRQRRARIGNVWVGWQTLYAGVVAVVAWSGVQVVVGYVQWFAGLAQMPGDLRQGIAADFVVPGMNLGLVAELGLLAVLFAALAVVCARVVPLRGLGRGAVAAGLFGVGAVVVIALPQVIMPRAMLNFDTQAIPGKLTAMGPVALNEDDGASFYIDRRARGLWLGRRQLLESLTGADRFDYEDDGPLFEALAGGGECADRLEAAVAPDGEDAPAVCVTGIEAKLYCEGLGLRLPTPEEWAAAFADPGDGPIERGPFAEWTMRLVHGNPTFELMGVEGVADAPADLKPDRFSDKVGFRCAFTFGPPAEAGSAPSGREPVAEPARSEERKTDSLFRGRLYIDRIAASEQRAGIAAAVAARLAERFDKHFEEGVLTSAELGAAPAGLERSTPGERPAVLARATEASFVLIGELIDIEDGLWVNLALYDAAPLNRRIVNRLSERAGATPESVLAALERGLDQMLSIPVGEKAASKELISKLIHSRIGIVKHCYDEALQRRPGLAGKLMLEVTISAEGTFVEPGIVDEGTTLRDEALHRCVIEGMSGIHTGFTFEDATRAKYPFEFHPGEDAK